MRWFLIIHNPNYKTIKAYFEDVQDIVTFLLDLKREGPIGEDGKIVEVPDELEYLIDSISVFKIGPSKYFRDRMLQTRPIKEADPTNYFKRRNCD